MTCSRCKGEIVNQQAYMVEPNGKQRHLNEKDCKFPEGFIPIMVPTEFLQKKHTGSHPITENTCDDPKCWCHRFSEEWLKAHLYFPDIREAIGRFLVTTSQALEKARALEVHRVGESEQQMLNRIASALMRAWADGMQSVTNHMSEYHCKIVDEKAVRIRAEANKLEKGD